MTRDNNEYPCLTLVDEKRIHKLLNKKKPGKKDFEASGVVHLGGYFYVVFDNSSLIGRFRDDLSRHESAIIGTKLKKIGYEGITYDSLDNVFYTIVESKQQEKRKYYASIHEYSPQFELLNQSPLDFEFTGENKGFEGVAYVFREGRRHLLALCEGNACSSKDAGKEPGSGRIQVFKQDQGNWVHSHMLALPDAVPFVDYSGLDVRDGRIAVTSQESSMLWVSTLDVDGWTLARGKIYRFPRTQKQGKVKYCNVEGVSWITPDRLVVVSDARKKDQSKKCKTREQSVHIFKLPA